ncbi:MAG: NAD(P)/FAD-dependent oxidoreductase [Hyphomonadaceae bacterium]|nr:NAD(P)/FAD-dependent oxidoreductase [Hyphomonadaceae bacterium]
MTLTPRKVVIVGGGIAGLCAGVYAQRCGYQAQILEQHSIPGGLATSWTRGDYTFETCLHWFLGSSPEGVLGVQWREVFDVDKLAFIQAEEYQRIETEDGRSLIIYADVDRMEAEFLRVAPEDAEDIKAFAGAIRQLADFPMDAMNAAWPRRAIAMLRFAPKLPLLQRWSSISAAEFGAGFKHELLRRFFTDSATADMAVLALVFMFAWMTQKNAGYPLGGAKAIIEPIAERFRALGGEMRLMTPVRKILVEEDVAIGVETGDGETVKADWVISAADGHATIYDMLGGAYRDATIDTFYKQQKLFPSYLQVSLGLARDCAHEPGFLARVLSKPLRVDPETELETLSFRIFHFDPTFAPAGKTAVTCFLPTFNDRYWLNLHRNDPVTYESEKRRIAEAVVAVLERRLPGIGQDIEVRDVSTPATVVHFTGNWRGSMEGFLPTPATGFAPRRQTLPGLEHFLMVGQWVHPGGGLPSGLMTARAALKAICRRDHTPFLPGASGGRARADAA